MNRRRLLALFAGGSATLAGCSALGDDDSPDVTPHDVPDGTDERTAGRVVRRGGEGGTARFRFEGATYEATAGEGSGGSDSEPRKTETPTPVE